MKVHRKGVATVTAALLATAMAATWQLNATTVKQAVVQPPASADRIDVARFDKDGEMIRPADLDQWVFLGTSLGMGYNEADFDASNPGMFQITLMEPTAYAYFMAHGDYAEGTMFVLNFYGSNQRLSTNRSWIPPYPCNGTATQAPTCLSRFERPPFFGSESVLTRDASRSP